MYQRGERGLRNREGQERGWEGRGSSGLGMCFWIIGSQERLSLENDLGGENKRHQGIRGEDLSRLNETEVQRR